MRHFLAMVLVGFLTSCANINLTSPAVLSPFGDGTQWVVLEDMTFDVRFDDKSLSRIVVPRGFVTDLASTPPIVWSKFPPFGKYLTAAILHDYLYWRQTCARGDADKIIYQAMHDAGVDQITQTAFYEVLRNDLAGGKAWETNRKERTEQRLIRVIPEEELTKRTPVTNWSDYRKSLFEKNAKESFPQSDDVLKRTCGALGRAITVRTNLAEIFLGL